MSTKPFKMPTVRTQMRLGEQLVNESANPELADGVAVKVDGKHRVAILAIHDGRGASGCYHTSVMGPLSWNRLRSEFATLPALALTPEIVPPGNLIIEDIKANIVGDVGDWPMALTQAVICNDLKGIVRNLDSAISWHEIDAAVRYVITHVPTGIVERWQRKFGKGGAS